MLRHGSSVSILFEGEEKETHGDEKIDSLKRSKCNHCPGKKAHPFE